MNSTAGAGDLAPYAGAYGEQIVSVAGDRLNVVRGRRPPVVLARLEGDLFTVVGDPSRRQHAPADRLHGLTVTTPAASRATPSTK